MLLPAQTYSALWKQYDEAVKKDLPQSARQQLDRIMTKSDKEKRHGQYLKALTERVKIQADISADSLRAELKRIDKRAFEERDTVRRAVLNAVMCRALDAYRVQIDGLRTADEYRSRAVEHPQTLAAVQAKGYSPFVTDGVDSGIFHGDLLNVVCRETENYDAMHAYYVQSGNRRAACISALMLMQQNIQLDLGEDWRTSKTVASYDSLIKAYSDVDVVAEIAVERCIYLCRKTGATAAEQIADIERTLGKWSSWKTANKLRRLQEDLTRIFYRFVVDTTTVLPSQSAAVRFHAIRNINSITIRAYRLNVDGRTTLNPNKKDDLATLMRQANPVPQATITRSYADYKEYERHGDTLYINPLPVGVYLLEFSSLPKMDVERTLLYVSNVSCLAEKLPGDTMRYVVVDATTGHPLPHAKLGIMRQTNNEETGKWTTLTCNEQGEVLLPNVKHRAPKVFPHTENDRFANASYIYSSFSYYENKRQDVVYRLFTDRRIYRPGQTVRVSAVAYRNGENASVVAGDSFKVALRDVKYEIVDEKQLTTDAFGAASTEFVLPATGMTGQFTLTVKGGASTSIRIEEYKRPTFRVALPEVKDTYNAGDTLRLRAKAESFAGVGVQDAVVKYTVRRSPALWWRFRNWDDDAMRETVIGSGTGTTSDDGTFEIDVPLTMPDAKNHRAMFFNFTVEATVTDLAGETQCGILTLPLGSRSAHLSSDISEKMLADSMKSIRFALHNAAGKEVEGAVRFRLDGEKKWREVSTAEPFVLRKKLVSGRHSLEAIAAGDTLRQDFVVFSLADKRPCVPTDEWFFVSDESFRSDGRPVTVQVGTSDEDIHVVYTMISGNKVLENGSFRLSNELHNRKFTYRDEYGNGILLTYAWMKNGRIHQYSTTIKKPQPAKRLTLKWHTFRDRLTPGAHEEWRLSIAKTDGTPAEARLMATLYDKSLDMLAPHQWHLNGDFVLSLPYTHWAVNYISAYRGYRAAPQEYVKQTSMDYARFYEKMFGRPPYYAFGGMYINEIALSKQMKTSADSGSMRLRGTNPRMASLERDAAKATQVSYIHTEEEVATEASADAAEAGGGTADAPLQLRENFNETAFFTPSILTDVNGEAVMSFTLPESVTTWRFMGVAHTKDMCVGNIESEAVAKKDVMVMPNIPRFLRAGDEANITTRIVNTSDKDISGTVKMLLLDHETEAVVHSEEQPFAVEKGKTAGATFACQPDNSRSLLVCRIIASGATYSDGEQHYLPVLSDMEMITRTIPVTLHGAGTKTVSLKDLFPNADESNSLTVEYMDDPSWLMLQTLPAVGTPRENNAVEQCEAYYTNAIAAYLLDKRPQTNDLFDRRTLADMQADALEKMAKLQNEDGSWSWWEGMRGSNYMTVCIAEMLTRLNVMTGYRPQTAYLLDKAYAYMDKELVSLVKRMKADEKRGRKPSSVDMTTLKSLYIASVRDAKVSDGTKERPVQAYKPSAEVKNAINYLLPVLSRSSRNLSIYAKAMAAVVLAENRWTTKSREFVKSLKEYSVFTNEMGRYYDTPRAEYSWYSYKIPTQVMAIEAIRTVTPKDTLTVGEMLRWLLGEKRTQLWGNAINNANAVYAFFDGTSNANQSLSAPKISIDGTPLEMPPLTAGTGSAKTTIDNPQGDNLTIEKTSQGTSWGAVYAQFMQKATDVEAQGSGITVKRDIIVGDRITVRITIEASRDFDFVQVTDGRAACMEPVNQLSGYRNGCYCSVKDSETNYYFDKFRKGTRVIETEYYIAREGTYTTGTCTAGCAYAPEYRATVGGETITVKKK